MGCNKGGSKQGQCLQNKSKNPTRRKRWRNRLSQQHDDQRIKELNSQYIRIIVRKNFFQEKGETIESTENETGHKELRKWRDGSLRIPRAKGNYRRDKAPLVSKDWENRGINFLKVNSVIWWYSP